MNHIFDRFLAQATSKPDETFCYLVKSGVQTRQTFGDVALLSSSIMTALIEAGVDKRGIVLIVLEHSIYQYPSFIAAVLRGAIPSFMAPLTTKQDPDVYRSSLEALMVRIQPVAILTSERASGSIPDTGIPILKVDNLDHANPSPVSVLIENAKTIEATETALMQHSSGTTGLKKGVMLSHHKIIEQCLTYASTIELLPGDKIASWLPLYHDMGLIACFLMPCIIGNVIISIDALEWVLRPTVLLQKITEHEANFVWLPNFAFLHILRTDLGRTTWNMRSLKALISCSEPCRSATFDAFYERYRHSGLQRGSLQVSYALAEYVFAVSHTSKGSFPTPGHSPRTQGFVSCGAALPGTKVEIRNDDAQILADGEIGEVWINGPCMFEGYFRQPDLTRQRIVDGWFRTGDLGTIESHELFIIGRVDDLIIINGKNIMAHEVEDSLNKLPGLIPGRILVYGEYDDMIGTTNLLVIAERDHVDEERRAIEVNIRNCIYSTSGVYPAEINFVNRGFLLKSTSGKISRKASYEKLKGDHDRGRIN